jgi:hypothetical protein
VTVHTDEADAGSPSRAQQAAEQDAAVAADNDGKRPLRTERATWAPCSMENLRIAEVSRKREAASAEPP